MANESAEEKDPADPIHQDAEGWWFWDEMWTERYGPFTTEMEAGLACVKYAEEVLGR